MADCENCIFPDPLGSPGINVGTQCVLRESLPISKIYHRQVNHHLGLGDTILVKENSSLCYTVGPCCLSILYI